MKKPGKPRKVKPTPYEAWRASIKAAVEKAMADRERRAKKRGNG